MNEAEDYSNTERIFEDLTSYLKDSGTRCLFSTPVVFTDLLETWKATNDSVKVLFLCNHEEETDTTLVLHACLQDTNVFVFVKDIDVLLVLLIYIFDVTNQNVVGI